MTKRPNFERSSKFPVVGSFTEKATARTLKSLLVGVTVVLVGLLVLEMVTPALVAAPANDPSVTTRRSKSTVVVQDLLIPHLESPTTQGRSPEPHGPTSLTDKLGP